VLKLFSVLLLVALFSGRAEAYCTYTKEVLTKLAVSEKWQPFKETREIEIVPAVFGIMNSFDHDHKVWDYFFWHINCGQQNVDIDVLLETNTVPLTRNWVEIWNKPYRFEYNHEYRWIQRVRDQDFMIRFLWTPSAS